MWKDHTTPQPTHCTPVLLQLSTTAYVIDFNGQRLNLKFTVEPLPNALRCTEMSGCEWRLQAPHARQTPLNAFNTRRVRCRRGGGIMCDNAGADTVQYTHTSKQHKTSNI